MFLVWVWQRAQKARLKQVFLAGLAIASVPLVSSLPFLVWNAEGFVRSVLFSATRYGATQFSVPSIDIIFGWEGLAGRILMLALLACVYLLAFKKPGHIFLFSFFAMSVFIDYNSVLFSQYPVWVAPMIPLIFLDVKENFP